MKLLKTLRDTDINPQYIPRASVQYRSRTAARAVVQDEAGHIALLAVTKNNYHKLPGGGVEEGEDINNALAREIMEEIGCIATVTGEVGQINEYRDEENLSQESLCYTALSTGEKGKPDFTPEELADGFAVEWVANLEEAIAVLEADKPADYNGKFIQQRDLTFLREFKANRQ